MFDTVSAWTAERESHLRAGITLRFVSTMGALHLGHLSSLAQSRRANDRTLVSIFVNAFQFDDLSASDRRRTVFNIVNSDPSLSAPTSRR